MCLRNIRVCQEELRIEEEPERTDSFAMYELLGGSYMVDLLTLQYRLMSERVLEVCVLCITVW